MAILTVSREFGSGGREIAQGVARLLSYEYVDKERILSDLRAAGGEWGKRAQELDEHRPTIWEKYDWSFRGFSALIQSCILNHALRGNAVIVGRGGNFLLKDIPSALNIRITAPLDKRLRRIMMRESVDMETARWLAKKTDKDRASFIHAIYNKQLDDPAEYDLIFDTSIKSEDEIVKTIKDLLMEKDQFTSDIKTLQMRAEAARVQAALLTNPRFIIPTLEVYHDGKDIVLRGIVHTPHEHKLVEEEAKRIAKGLPVRCELHYRK